MPGPNAVKLGEAIMAFADSHHHLAPSNAADALCAQRAREQRHLHALAPAPADAPRSTEQERLMTEWQPGEHLDWVIDMAIEHVRARTDEQVRGGR